MVNLKQMRKLLMIAIAGVLSLGFLSCGNDDDEDGGGGSSSLLGTWKLVWTDYNVPEEDMSEGLYLIQFRKDGKCVTVSDDEDGVFVSNGKYSADDRHISFVSIDEDDWQFPLSMEVTKRESSKIFVSATLLWYQVSGYLEKVPDSEIEKYLGDDDRPELKVNGVVWAQHKSDKPVYHTVFSNGTTNYINATFTKSGEFWWPDYLHFYVHTGNDNIKNNMSLTDMLKQGKNVTVEIQYFTDLYEDNEVGGYYCVKKNNYTKASGTMKVKSIEPEGNLTIEFNNFIMPQDSDYVNTGAPDKLRLDGTVTFSYTGDII